MNYIVFYLLLIKFWLIPNLSVDYKHRKIYVQYVMILKGHFVFSSYLELFLYSNSTGTRLKVSFSCRISYRNQWDLIMWNIDPVLAHFLMLFPNISAPQLNIPSPHPLLCSRILMFSWTSFSFPQGHFLNFWLCELYLQVTCHAVVSLAFLCCGSVTKSHLTLCHSMDCSTPGLPVLHYLPEFAQISNSHPLSQWCHLTISSSVVPFSPCPQSLPASGSFPMNHLNSSH